MKLRILIAIFVLLSLSEVHSQNYKKDYFRSPLNIPIKLIGNFGEIRPNHFHSGIDLKVPFSGVNLYAAADGYVSRIRKAPGGYGNALYITHPNGLMTVYGHMQKFNKELEQYAESIQYEQNSFEFTEYPDSTKFVLKKGDLIGYAGNSGRSYGPHLHFEIREADKDIPLNPLYFDFGIKDNLPPKIFNLAVYPIDNESRVFNSSKNQFFKLYKKGSNYHLNKTIRFSGKIGFAFNAYDYVNNTKNSQGVYAVKLFLNDTLIYSHRLDKVSFYESRYINSFIDYKERQISNRKFQKCYIDPGNKLGIYPESHNRGIIQSKGAKTKNIKIEVSDIAGNKSYIKFKITPEEHVNNNIKIEKSDIFNFDKENYFVKENFRAYLKKGGLYTDVDINYSVSPGLKDLYSKIHKLNSYLIPLHENMHIAINAENIPKEKLKKALIVYINRKNTYESIGGSFLNGFMVAKTKKFGKFAIAVDNIPPAVSMFNDKGNYDYSERKKISLTITDNLSGIKNYFAEIDGVPIIFEYDEKNNRITYTFDKRIKLEKKHTLKITVFDKKNNKSVFQTIFFK